MICPKCKTENCVRQHSPAKRTGAGQRRSMHKCSSCGQLRRTSTLRIVSEEGSLLKDVQQCRNCRGLRDTTTIGRCGICSREEVRIVFSRSDGISVGQCCYHAPIETCELCGNLRPVTFRVSNGAAVCLSCYVRELVPRWSTCAFCDRENIVAKLVVAGVGVACPSCYNRLWRPKDTCSICHQTAPIAVRVDTRGRLQTNTAAAEVQSSNNGRTKEKEEGRPYLVCIGCYQSSKDPKFGIPLGKCPGCGRFSQLPSVNGSKQRCCKNCYKKGRAKTTTCRICGQACLNEGFGLCRTCYIAQRVPEPCSSCGKLRKVAKRIGDKPLCAPCSYPKRECSRCHQITAVHKITHTGETLCVKCARTEIPRAQCSQCLKEKALAQRIPPLCKNCHRKQATLTAECSSCHKTVVLQRKNPPVCSKCYSRQRRNSLKRASL